MSRFLPPTFFFYKEALPDEHNALRILMPGGVFTNRGQINIGVCLVQSEGAWVWSGLVGCEDVGARVRHVTPNHLEEVVLGNGDHGVEGNSTSSLKRVHGWLQEHSNGHHDHLDEHLAGEQPEAGPNGAHAKGVEIDSLEGLLGGVV